jgi:hypothetical protein
MPRRNILGFVGASSVRTTIYGNVEGVTAAHRDAWIGEVENMGRRAV